MRTKDLKSSKAITLIALVVTIIVILILAGVAVMALTGDNGLIKKASEAKLLNEKARIEEIMKMEYLTKLIDNRGEKPSKETAISAMIGKLEEEEYEVKTVTNSGSTYQGVELLEVIDTSGSEVDTILLQQTDSTHLHVNLKMTEGTTRIYVNIGGLYHEILYSDESIELSEEGQAKVDGEEYSLKIVPTTTYATMTLDGNQITTEQSLVSGADITIEALSEIGDETFTIKVERPDGSTRDTVQGTVSVVLKPIHPNSITITSAGNATEVKVGQTLQLTATTDPSPITDDIVWSSSDTSKATVSTTGLVTGVATGSVTITATATDSQGGTHGSQTFNLTIKPSTVSITIQSEDTSKGTVASGINGTHTYLEGAEIVLTAIPASGYELDGWYIGSSKIALTSGNKYTVPTNGTASITITAKFNQEPEQTSEIDYLEKTAETIEVGDDLKIGIESFRVIGKTSRNILAIPYYNITLDEVDPIQSPEAATTPFAQYNFWYNTDYPGDVLPYGEIVAHSDNLIQPYISAYSNKLKNLTGNKARAQCPGDWSEINQYFVTSGSENQNPSSTGGYWTCYSNSGGDQLWAVSDEWRRFDVLDIL